MKEMKQTNRLAKIECRFLAAQFFGDELKADAWFDADNQMLGGVSPNYLIKVGRAKQLLKFIETQLEENERMDT